MMTCTTRQVRDAKTSLMTTPPRRCRAAMRSTMTTLWLQLRARTQLRCEIPHLITKKQLAPTHRHQRQCRVLRQPWRWLREIGYGDIIRYYVMATALFIIPYSGKAGSGLGNCRRYCVTSQILRHLECKHGRPDFGQWFQCFNFMCGDLSCTCVQLHGHFTPNSYGCEHLLCS